MKKMMMTMMAAAVIATTGTALAATPGRGYCRDDAPRYEASYTCGGGYYGRGRGGYGCGGGGGYCYNYEGNDNEG